MERSRSVSPQSGSRRDLTQPDPPARRRLSTQYDWCVIYSGRVSADWSDPGRESTLEADWPDDCSIDPTPGSPPWRPGAVPSGLCWRTPPTLYRFSICTCTCSGSPPPMRMSMITASSCREVSLSTTMLACSSTWCVPFPRDLPFYLILCTRSRFTLLSRVRAFTSASSCLQHLWDLLELEDGMGGLSMSMSGLSPIPTLKQQCSIDFSTNLLVDFF